MKLQILFVIGVLIIVGCSSPSQSTPIEQISSELPTSTSGMAQAQEGIMETSKPEVVATIETTAVPTITSQDSPEVSPEPITQENPGWTMITPGGDVVCADGSPYSFWVHPGNPEKLFVYFQGFNRPFFCNDAESCSNVDYDDSIHLAEEYSVAALIDVNADEPDRIDNGVFDFDNPDNPLRDFSIVYVPICTADLHWGNNLQSYTTESGESFEVYHQGYNNAQGALSWAYENLPEADQIFVSGCEVGAAGSVLHTVSLRENYPEAFIAQLGEGYAGIFPEKVDFNSAWNVRSSIPDWLNDSLPESFSIADLYMAIAEQYPEINFAQFNYAEDFTQAINYTRQTFEGVVFEEDINYDGFTRDLLESLGTIHEQVPNFSTYTVYGEEESKLPSNCGQVSAFMELMKVEDVHYLDWLTALINGDEVSNIEGVLTYEKRE